MFKNTFLRYAINANIAGILLMDSKILCSLFVQSLQNLILSSF